MQHSSRPNKSNKIELPARSNEQSVPGGAEPVAGSPSAARIAVRPIPAETGTRRAAIRSVLRWAGAAALIALGAKAIVGNGTQQASACARTNFCRRCTRAARCAYYRFRDHRGN